MSRRRSQRVKSKVDYSKLSSIEGLSEDEDEKRTRQELKESDSDEFRMDEEEVTRQEQSDEHMSDVGIPEVESPEVVEEEFEVKTPRERVVLSPIVTPGSAPRAPKRAAPKTATPKSLSKVAVKPPRSSTRNESLKERLSVFFGGSDEELIYAINERARWSASVFVPRPDLFTVPEPLKHVLASIHYQPDARSQKLVPQPVGALANFLPPIARTVDLQTELNGKLARLPAFESVPIHGADTKSGVILNAGSPVTSCKWAPGHEHSPIQYLAVAILTDETGEEPTSASAVRPGMAVFSTQGHRSSFQIYQIDTRPDSVQQCTLMCTICSEFGTAASLAWRPLGPHNDGHIGLLAACFQDGKVRVFDISKPDQPLPVHCVVDSPLRTFSVETKITCLTWRTVNCIAVATSDGFIAEFDVSDESLDGNYPSYLIPAHASLINSIASGFPNHQELVCTTSTDGYTRLFDVRDVRRSKAISNRVKGYATCSAYCCQLSSFISLEDTFTSKLIPIRKVNLVQGATDITNHEGTVTSMAVSFLHPIIITGGADGTLRIGNAIRKATVSKRQTGSVYKEAMLWRFEVSEKTKTYRFTDILKSTDTSKQPALERQIIFPRAAVVTSIDWNPSMVVGSWYAAGLSGGLVRIENLSPAG
jgi:transcription factor C subunit 6